MSVTLNTTASALIALLLLCNSTQLSGKEVSLGAGSYSLERPEHCEALPEKIYKIPSLTGATPTNQWWSSLVWNEFSQPLFAHPMVLLCTNNGLVVSDPGSAIDGSSGNIMGGGIPQGGDLTIAMEGIQFPQANYAGSSDWFITAEFSQDGKQLLTHFGHGSPYVFCEALGGKGIILCGEKPIIWAGDENSATLGVSLRGHHYGIFGPAGSKWSGIEGQKLTNSSPEPYFTIALLPDNSPETLALFAEHAHNHVSATRVTFKQQKGSLHSRYQFTLTAKEKGSPGTLTALYPHQWKYSPNKPLNLSYPSVRGEMKLVSGLAFTTEVPIQGLLPMLPKEGIPDRARMLSYLSEEASKKDDTYRDTYWEGKHLGKLATLAGIAEVLEAAELREQFLSEVKTRLENWFTAEPSEEAPKFYYNQNWGTLIGSKPSYGSDSQINDHHFHYGYFIRAAAEAARYDAAWGEKWAPMVELLIRDIAASDPADPLFPRMRGFDFYAGHSWASGHANFGDGNNQESSSESLNAWYGLMLWGEVTGNRSIRDTGLFLFNTERTAVEEYWFDVSGTNFPREFPNVALGMIWGGKGAFATWFSGDIDCIHGINWLPFTPASIYMGRFPDYVEKNYSRIVKEREQGNDLNNGWGDLVCMFGALSKPDRAADYIDANPQCSLEGGNTHAFMYHWIHTLNSLGRNDASVTSDHLFSNVYLKGGKRTYAAFNHGKEPLQVSFSDGTSLTAAPGVLTVK
ncbi:glycosyl hydrolase [Roseibacillus persicicus]|uniref:glucan endo-1,3-beta-D-glucosidase n=1 Tax=Roseibacillus persicicus TaxID=454148 RepID=A0A918TU71_9BACT|nr:glycosyl hydrolase [Roseibacillus persicicus]GHC60193.1 hypothetical protein GCM10007100_29330 [Roseibacillus persicicus]